MFVDVGSTFWQQKMKLWLSFFPQNFELKIAKFSSDNSLISLRDINRHQIWGQKVGVAALCPSSKKFSIFGTDRDINHNLSLKFCVCRKNEKNLAPQQLKMPKRFWAQIFVTNRSLKHLLNKISWPPTFYTQFAKNRWFQQLPQRLWLRIFFCFQVKSEKFQRHDFDFFLRIHNMIF